MKWRHPLRNVMKHLWLASMDDDKVGKSFDWVMCPSGTSCTQVKLPSIILANDQAASVHLR